ncbi:hypothetical protein DSUL_20376 [Desulfovibrionales bacterium]
MYTTTTRENTISTNFNNAVNDVLEVIQFEN